MLRRLPDFGETGIDELLDIRSELRPSLDRFRSGISTHAKDIQSAPWDEDFAAEADEIFIQQVKPGVIEIDDMIAATPSILECIGRGVFNSKSLSGGGIGFLIDQLLCPGMLLQRSVMGFQRPNHFGTNSRIDLRNRKRRKATTSILITS